MILTFVDANVYAKPCNKCLWDTPQEKQYQLEKLSNLIGIDMCVCVCTS